jgi:hypothetical protein
MAEQSGGVLSSKREADARMDAQQRYEELPNANSSILRNY